MFFRCDLDAIHSKTSPDSGHPADDSISNGDRAFYENVPFHHGLPHKQVLTVFQRTYILFVVVFCVCFIFSYFYFFII